MNNNASIIPKGKAPFLTILGGLLILFYFLLFPVAANSFAEAVDLPLSTIAIIDLEQVIKNHPLYKEFIDLEREYQQHLDYWQQKEQQLSLLGASQYLHLQNLDQDYEDDLRDIYENYQTRLAEYQLQLQQELDLREEEAWLSAIADLEEFLNQETLKAEERIEEYFWQLAFQLEEYQSSVEQEYSRQLFNLRLKLQMSHLSAEEAKKIAAEIAAIEEEINNLMQAKEEELNQKLHQFIAEQESELAQAIQKLQQEIEVNTMSFLAEQLQEFEEQFVDYTQHLESLMLLEMHYRKQEILEQNLTDIALEERMLRAELDLYRHQVTDVVYDLNQKLWHLKRQIENDIIDLTAQIAHREGYKLILTDVVLNLTLEDITELLILELEELE